MKIQDNRIDKTIQADIGDIILCNNNKYYMLIINDGIDSNYPRAILDLENNYIDMTTKQAIFCVGGTLNNHTIIEIIPKDKVSIVIG